MSYQVIFSSDTTSHVLVGGCLNEGGVAVLFEMNEEPVVLNGTPTPDQLDDIALINTYIFH